MPANAKPKKKIKRLEFKMTGDPDIFIVFEKHLAVPFWRSKEEGIRFVYAGHLNHTVVRAFVKRGTVSKATFPSSHAEFKRYKKIALARHIAMTSMLASLPNRQ
jgi:hypothetical protein